MVPKNFRIVFHHTVIVLNFQFITSTNTVIYSNDDVHLTIFVQYNGYLLHGFLILLMLKLIKSS